MKLPIVSAGIAAAALLGCSSSNTSSAGSNLDAGSKAGAGGAISGSGGTGTGATSATGGAGGMGAGGGATGTGGNASQPDAGKNPGATPCSSSKDCTSATNAPVCDVTGGVCVACLASSDCTSTKDPVCEVSTNKCVQCLATSDCKGGNVCNVAAHDCTATCGTVGGPSDAGDAGQPCSGKTPFCNATKGFCVQCLTSADCAALPGKPVCAAKSGKCEQ